MPSSRRGTLPAKREAIKDATFDSTIALELVLTVSQMVLSMQLPFAIVPLIMFTLDRRKMGELIAPRWMTVLAVIVAAVAIVSNIEVVVDALAE